MQNASVPMVFRKMAFCTAGGFSDIYLHRNGVIIPLFLPEFPVGAYICRCVQGRSVHGGEELLHGRSWCLR